MASQFELRLKKLAGDIKIKHADVINKVGLEFHNRVVRKTPVDTGRARAGWDYSGATQAMPVAHTENNVEYIRVLEDGHSQQAPHGMVRVTLAEIKEEYS